MKFARLLRATAFEGMPQMETLFSAYKALKVGEAEVLLCCVWAPQLSLSHASPYQPGTVASVPRKPVPAASHSLPQPLSTT